MLTPDRRDALQRLCEKATPGPWAARRAANLVDGAYDYAVVDTSMEVIIEAFGRTSVTNWPPSESNAAFIAEARTALPEALAEIDRLKSPTMALEIADAILKDLSGRSGIVDGVAGDVIAEIQADLAQVILAQWEREP